MTTTALVNVLDVEAAKGPPQREAEGSRYRFAAMAVCGIWGALAAASIWSPDLISGTDGPRGDWGLGGEGGGEGG